MKTAEDKVWAMHLFCCRCLCFPSYWNWYLSVSLSVYPSMQSSPNRGMWRTDQTGEAYKGKKIRMEQPPIKWMLTQPCFLLVASATLMKILQLFTGDCTKTAVNFTHQNNPWIMSIAKDCEAWIICALSICSIICRVGFFFRCNFSS